ncbi:MAG TPA: S8 family peptidase [Thermoleophilaceae bacterium]|nr:S8 family peptidase [Thermoleophilaceae bacterium]
MKRFLTLSGGLGAVVAAVLAASAGAAAEGRQDGPVQGPSAPVADELIVGYEKGATAAARERAGRKVRALDRDALVRGSGKSSIDLFELRRGASESRAIQALEADPAVAYAEPNWRLTKLATSGDPYYTGGRLWGMYGDQSPLRTNPYGSQAAESWNAGATGSSNVVIGVIDEGVMVNHPDLDANIWRNPGETPGDGVDNDGNGYADDVNGWDFANNDRTVFDGNPPADFTTDEHGTHVAGTIGAEANREGVAGVNWNVGIVSGKFLGPNGGTTAAAIKAVDYMTGLENRGANIVATNNSWGGGGYSQGLHDAVIRAAKADILFIAAAGNEGRNNDRWASYPANYNTTRGTSTQSPASYDAVISVAAIASNGSRPRWSNYGRTTVDIGAPGAAIESTVPQDSSGTAYWAFDGTSMATPHVSGAAALYESTHPGATAPQIRNAILGSAVRTSSLVDRTVTAGRLNVSAALAR